MGCKPNTGICDNKLHGLFQAYAEWHTKYVTKEYKKTGTKNKLQNELRRKKGRETYKKEKGREEERKMRDLKASVCPSSILRVSQADWCLACSVWCDMFSVRHRSNATSCTLCLRELAVIDT
jgi:hypothetical protein